MNIKSAFALGWGYGKLFGEPSRRDAERMHSGWTEEEYRAFLNGAEDGVKGDKFRLDMKAEQ